MGIVRLSRIFLAVAAFSLLLAAIACESDEPETEPAETPASTEQVMTADSDGDDGRSHDNGDSDSDSQDKRSYDYGDSGSMGLGDDEMALAMQFLTALTSMKMDAEKPAEQPSKFGVIGDAQDTGIWVDGVGVVSAPPDLAELDLGVSATADTVSEARDSAAEAMTAIVASLIGGGVAPADIRTRHISIQPQYDWQEVIDEGIRRSERVLTGYQVSNTVIVRVRDLDSVSEILDGAVAAGGDVVRVNGINFRIEDTTALAKEARELAVADALAKAGELASYSGVNLGRMVFLSETSAQPVFAERTFAAVASDAAVSTPISPGEQEVRVTVRAVFDIQGS